MHPSCRSWRAARASCGCRASASRPVSTAAPDPPASRARRRVGHDRHRAGPAGRAEEAAPHLRRPLPRAHALRLHRPLVAVGDPLGDAHPDLGRRASPSSGLNLGIDFEGGTQWQLTGQGQSASVVGDVRDVVEAARAQGPEDPDRGRQARSGSSPRTLPSRGRSKITAALAEVRGHRHATSRPCSVTRVGPTWGDKVSSKALTALIVFFFVIALLPLVPLRVADGARRDHRGDPRHHHHRRRLRGHRVRGHARDGRRVPHHSRVLAVRHRRRVRQDQGEPRAPRHRPRRHLLVDGEPLAQPGADALDQHVDRGAAPGGVAALRRQYAFGGLALRDFALALFVGLLTGAYSSIFVATPILAWLKEREPATARCASGDRRLAKAAVVAPVPPIVAGEPADVPVDGEDIDPGDDLDPAGPQIAVAAPAPAAPAPAPTASATPYGTSYPSTTPSRGAANPRGRQQRGKKKKR